MGVEVLAALEGHIRAGMVERPADNPFFEKWALEAAAHHLADRPVDVVAAADGSLIPLTRWLNAPAALGSVWTVWDHIHCFDTTPAAANAAAVMDSLLGHLNENSASMLRWSGLPTDTPFYRELMLYLDHAGLQFESTKARARPLLLAGDAGESVADAARLGGKRMAELRRQRRRLEEMGKLSTRIHSGVHDAGVWISDFLELEASGWKGANGTAIACNAGEHAYFETLMLEAAAQGKALICSLELDGRPIGMTVNLRSGDRAWGFKTAYRDELSRYSPGVLVACETTLHALEDPSIAWMDSCMENDGGMVGSLWRGRRETVDLMISTRRSSNWLPGAAKMALNVLRLAKTVQSAAARSLERSISRIVTGITSIVVLPEMPTVVLSTAII